MLAVRNCSKISGFGELNMFIFHSQVTGKEVPHNPSWSLPVQIYAVIHFLLVLKTYQDLFENKMVCICHIRQSDCY